MLDEQVLLNGACVQCGCAHGAEHFVYRACPYDLADGADAAGPVDMGIYALPGERDTGTYVAVSALQGSFVVQSHRRPALCNSVERGPVVSASFSLDGLVNPGCAFRPVFPSSPMGGSHFLAAGVGIRLAA